MSETDQSKEPKEEQNTEGAVPAAAATGEKSAGSAATDSANAAPGGADELAAVRQEAAAAQDRYLRALADLENFRRRSVREKEELRAFAAARVVEELLPVMDNFALGLTAARAPNADVSTLLGGFEMVATQLKTALSNHGLKEVNPQGQPFDPNLHEALSQIPSADVAEGHVIQVVRIGYTLNGRLLRPAAVVVSGGVPAGKDASS